MMKKWMGAILALALTLALGCTALALEIEMNEMEVSESVAFGDEILLGYSDYLNDISGVAHIKDGKLTVITEASYDYISSYGALSEEKKAEWDAKIAQVVPGDDGLYAYAQYGRQLYKWDGEKLNPIGQPLPEELLVRDSYVLIPRMCVVGGKVLMAIEGDEYNDYVMSFITVDLQTGEQKELELGGVDYVMNLCVYKDGQALLCYQDPENDYYPVLRAVDVEAGTFVQEPLLVLLDSYNISGVTYDAASDTVCYFDGSRLSKKVGNAQPEIVAYPLVDYIRGAALVQGEYVTVAEGVLQGFPIDGSILPTQTLTLQNGYLGGIVRDFLKENPDVGIGFSEEWYGNSADIAEAIKTGTMKSDIMNVDINNGLYALINKGYAQDLSASEVISATVDGYYPNLVKPLRGEDGKIYGVYDYLSAYSVPKVDETLWAAFDLGDYPTTYSELADVITRWQTDYADDNPDINIIGSIVERSELVRQVIRAFILQHENTPGGLNFNDPALRETLEKIEQIPDMDNIDWENMDNDDIDALNERYNRRSILSLDGTLFDEGRDEEHYNNEGEMTGKAKAHLLDPLTIAPDDEKIIRADAQVYIINPESPNKDIAIKYLEYLVTHPEGRMDYLLDPTKNEPLRDPNLDETIKYMQRDLERLIEQMESAEEVDKADFQQSIDYYQTWLAEKEENPWEINETQIKRYRELADFVRVPSESMLLGYDGEGSPAEQINEMVSRYNGGQLTLDAFLREMNQKVNMIVLEGR